MLDEKGFNRPSYNEIVEDLKQSALQTLGYDMNVSDTGNLGKLLKIMAYMTDKVWQDVEGSYYSSSVDTANGTSLDRVASNMASSRSLNEYASVTVTFVGTAGYVIEQGFEVSTDDNIIFYTTTEATVGDNGMVDVICLCEESGAVGNIGAGKITTVVQPVANIVGVSNTQGASGGKDVETDAEFRERLKEVRTASDNKVDTMLNSIFELNGVMSATMQVNDKSVVVDDLDPNSFKCYVYGGSDAEIGNVIFNHKPIGIEPLGDIEVNVADVSGTTHIMRFSRPEMEDIYVSVRLITTEDFNSLNEVRTAIVRYIGGLDADQSYYYGLKMNETCIYTKLVNIAMSFAGVTDVEILVSSDNVSWDIRNITPQANCVLEVRYDNINVEVV